MQLHTYYEWAPVTHTFRLFLEISACTVSNIEQSLNRHNTHNYVHTNMFYMLLFFCHTGAESCFFLDQ